MATQSIVQFRRILIPVDFSPCALEAYRVALALTRMFGAELILLHVIDTKALESLDRLGLAHMTAESGQIKRLRRHARIKARELLDWEETTGLSIRRVVAEGVPFVEIGRLVRMDQIDLVVLGSWGGETGNIERIFFGSTAEKVVRMAGCPVLTVPLPVSRKRIIRRTSPKGGAMKTNLVRRILSATDFPKSAIQAQDYAVFLAEAYDTKLQVVHVSERPLWFRPSAPAALYLEQAREEATLQLVQLGSREYGLKRFCINPKPKANTASSGNLG